MLSVFYYLCIVRYNKWFGEEYEEEEDEMKEEERDMIIRSVA